eukprot:superscaffoldBa00002137_g13316
MFMTVRAWTAGRRAGSHALWENDVTPQAQRNFRRNKLGGFFQFHQELLVKHYLLQVLKGSRAGEEPWTLTLFRLGVVSCATANFNLMSRSERWKERARKRASFIANPFGFTKSLLGQKRDGNLVCSKEELDLHFQNIYSDPNRQIQLGQCDILVGPPPPTKVFDTREPLLKEVQEIVRKARSSYAPGPSGFPYKVYKYCPLLLKRLWKILRVIWRREKVVLQWSNNYIDASVQKGGISGVPGCLEHTGVVTQLIREARENKGDLTVLWLDLANAYGSIPHKMVKTTMTKHHVPHHVADLILDYYDQFRMRVSAGAVTSEWYKLE